jgi:hypothetical protein
MGQFVVPEDLTPFAVIDPAKAGAMISDSEAMAVLTAPCLPDLLVAPEGESPADAARREAKLSALKAILRGAILRWNDTGSGAITTTQVGPFGQTIAPSANRKSMFWPSEIEQLQGLCSSGDSSKAFAVDTVGGCSAHLPWCSLMFGATYCSCGVDIAGEPIFEVG